MCLCVSVLGFFSVLFAPGYSAKARSNERSEEESGNLHAWSGGCFVLGYCLGPRLLLMPGPIAVCTGALFLPEPHALAYCFGPGLALGACCSLALK